MPGLELFRQAPVARTERCEIRVSLWPGLAPEFAGAKSGHLLPQSSDTSVKTASGPIATSRPGPETSDAECRSDTAEISKPTRMTRNGHRGHFRNWPMQCADGSRR